MAARILRKIQVVARTRPAWLPHPLMLHFIAALWLAAAVLQLAQHH